MEQTATWIKMKAQLPSRKGWYLVRYTGDKEIAMFFRTEKRSYSNSQWYVDANTGHDWQGRLPDEWLKLNRE